jgi:parallel beta-helix repeat protein
MKRLAGALLVCTALAGEASVAAVRHVDPDHPAAVDSGAGSPEQPYRTLGHAMRLLRPGDTLRIAGGTYREALVFPARDWSGPPTVIEPEPGGKVVIKGSSVVTGWQLVEPGLYVKRPWAVNSQQVFVDGVALKQIGGTIFGGYPEKPDHPLRALHAQQGGIWPGRTPGGVEQMTANSFHYDAATRSLYIKLSAALGRRVVEASVRTHVVFGTGLQNVTLRQLAFRHANTTAVVQNGAVTLNGHRLVLDRIDVADVDGAGFDITGDDNVIRASRANRCGQLGMKARGRRAQLIDNETSFNNTRGFNKWWEAGGAKFVGAGGLRDSEVRGHRAIGNTGDGIWFDWLNSNNRIHGSVSAYNTGFGIHYEASQRGYIYDNYVFANRQRGIYLAHSADSVVAHNLVARNALEGIAVIDEGRSPNRPELRPRRNRVFGNIVAWSGKAAIVLPAGLLENSSDYNLFLVAGPPPGFSLGWSPVRQGLAAWRAASGQDDYSWSLQFGLPQTLAAAFAAQQPKPDWSAVNSVASRYSVRAPEIAEIAEQPADPQPEAPGPRR